MWQRKEPTEPQVCSLGLDYEAFFLDAAEVAKRTGAITIHDLIVDQLDLVRKTIRKYDRWTVSRAISINSSQDNLPDEPIWKDLVRQMDKLGIDIKLLLSKF